MGQLVLPARGIRSRLSRRDEQLLGDLVRQAATAARTSRMADELQDSRERLVVAREEERAGSAATSTTGWDRPCHGVVFQVESARLLLDRDPETARSPRGHHRPREGSRRRRTPPRPRAAPAGPRRPRPGRRARPARRDAGAAGRRDRRRRPRCAARRGRGGGVPHRGRGAHQRRPPRRRPPCRVVCLGRAASCLSRSPTTGRASPPRRQAGVGLVSLRERAPSSAAAARSPARPRAAPSSGPGCPPPATPGGARA